MRWLLFCLSSLNLSLQMGKNSSGRVPTQEVKVFHPFSTSFISLVVEAYSKPSVCLVRGVAEIIFPPMTRFVSQPVCRVLTTTFLFWTFGLLVLSIHYTARAEKPFLFCLFNRSSINMTVFFNCNSALFSRRGFGLWQHQVLQTNADPCKQYLNRGNMNTE